MSEPPEKAALPRLPLWPRLLSGGVWLLLAALFWFSAYESHFSFKTLVEGVPIFITFFGKMMPPDWSKLPQMWEPVMETLQMAWLGTFFGVLLAAPLVFLGSINTSVNVPVMYVTRAFMTVIRSIPDLLYAAILVGLLAFGPLPGVAALTIFTAAVLAKMGSEVVEAIDPGPLEALRASGANGLQVIVYGVLPQIAATMTSFTLYIFEVNVRASTVLGFVGAGGIGFLLKRYLAFFQYERTAVLIIIIFVVVLVIDSVSSYVRSRLI
jgi:phosphonate transport system permease protein